MKLNARQVDAAKPREKAYKLADGAGLYLEVVPSGSRYWRMKYRFNGKEKRLAFGVYPAVSLAQARALRDDAKKKLAEGIDPSFAKKEEKLVRDVQLNNTFQTVALEWHGTKVGRWSEGYASDILEAFNKDIFPYIGQQPVNDIKPLVLLNVLRRMENRGATEKAKKVRQRCSEVFRYAIVTGRAEYNPAADLTSAMSGHESKHYPFLTVEELPDFFKALAGYTGSPLVVLAARLLILTGVRTGELRGAFWSEFDLEKAVWEIPAERMKMKRPHLVPLSTQALEIVQQLKGMTGQYPLVFPGRNDPRKTMSEASINQVFKRIGYTGKVTGHGFRHTMSTILHEEGFNTAWIETQLAHVDKNAIRGTYNHALYLEGRREMMQWYADCIDNISKFNLIIGL
ncbi:MULTISPECIES: tyrosine-type recombinase/integrase [Enterobacter cloacae complex]|uniref:tyrosine-type recombinase/integrase n=1 Tax=Enterobacter cloacae complex TaxID=354276 RepID=UPI000793CA11|nr:MULTISPECIES: integrase arm-type DNA-binding domain-containing protein [Enterobacter cloacae complex]MCU4100709.1 tyrosine-type recombinase/integrase [Enterobacter hormaechei subsp. steigerwaltii]HBW5537924.1 tyrosine-type recombinase/integrase [Klebsiella aerogenes]MBT2029507.1 tyrosine-type recombinase/integrase [Enterobacter roggenkampii]MBT2034045.1 tyrosine-type recombinase/integrase [Enterobacter roggenkampii]MCM7083368.1 tyrosine-type recombinase/integrase [Enterobacter roggenkampii]